MSDAAGPPPPRRDWTPTITGYRNLEEIGRGGFALVYRGEQIALRRTVAIKVVSGLDVDPSRLRRFERECAAIGSLSSHPHVVSVYDAGTTIEGLPFLSMEYLPEGSLADRLKKKGPLDPDDVIEIGIQLCGALEAAHNSDVLHRDIKPENILVGGQAQVKLADFGIAFVADTTSHTATGTMVGTVKHSAPEVLGGSRATVASDVYSLGSTMFALLTGTAPFWRASDESAMPAMLRATRDPLPDLREHGVPSAFAAVIERACAKNTRDRYQSAAEFGAALQGIQPQLGDSVTPMQTTEEPVAAAPLAAAAVAPPLDAPTPEAAVPEPITSASAPATPDAAPDVTTVDPVSSPPPTMVTPVAGPPVAASPAGGRQAAPPPTAAGAAGGGTKPTGTPPPGRSDGVSKSMLGLAVGVVVVLVLIAAFFIRRGDNDKLETQDGPSTTEQTTTTPSSEPSSTESTASSTSGSTTESTTTSTTAPPPPSDEQEIAEATNVAQSQYPGFTVTDTSGWRGKQGVSSIIAEDSEGREKIVVFIDGAFAGNDYTLPSYNLTMVGTDASGFTVDYDLFNAGEDDLCCAPVGTLRVRFELSGGGPTPLSASPKSATADRNAPNHR
jgi:serine/threonine protein kinase